MEDNLNNAGSVPPFLDMRDSVCLMTLPLFRVFFLPFLGAQVP